MKKKLLQSNGLSKEYHAFRSRFEAREEGTFHFVQLYLTNNERRTPVAVQVQE
jgi:hypothetical protein